MTDLFDEQPYTLYLLHFDPPLGNVQHYLGITRTKRLKARLQEHATAKGSRLTRIACRLGAGIYLTALIQCQDWTAERRFKTNGHFRSKCYLCNPEALPSVQCQLLREPRAPALAPTAAVGHQQTLDFERA